MTKLREIREKNGMTQEELAKKVGCSRPMISQIERGTKSASVLLAKIIADIFSVKIEDLI